MSKETREIAERLVAICEPGAGAWTLNQLTDAIDKALRDRDERAAKIADAVVADIDSIPEPTAHAFGKRTAAMAIAAAIRNGVANAK